MTLEKLNMLLTLVEEKNVTRAAEKLFITQPTMTAFLNKLENQLGFRLFDRSKNPVLPTDEGREYIKGMQELLVTEQKLIDGIRMKEKTAVQIHIGIGYVNSQMYMPAFTKRMMDVHPDVRLRISEGQEINLLNALQNGKMDIVFGHMPIEPGHILFEEICEQELILAIPESYIPEEDLNRIDDLRDENGVQTSAYTISPSLLDNIPLISPSSRQGLYLNLRKLLEQYNIKSRQIIETSNMITGTTMVGQGLGYMYTAPTLIEYARNRFTERVCLCTLPQLVRTRKYYMGYDERNKNVELIREIREIMRKVRNEPSAFVGT